MRVLARKYVIHRDKDNRWFDSIEEGMRWLNQTEDKVCQKVEWSGKVDIFFRDTKDYLRVTL